MVLREYLDMGLIIRLIVGVLSAARKGKYPFDFHYWNFFPLIPTSEIYELEYFLLSHLRMQPSEQWSQSFQKLLWLQRRHQAELDNLSKAKEQLEEQTAAMTLRQSHR